MVEVSDAAYMDAVAKGDMKTAQRMVDAAAKKAGMVEDGGFYVPDRGAAIQERLSGKTRLYRASDSGYAEDGQSFSEEISTANAYRDGAGFGGPNIFAYDVDTSKSLRVDGIKDFARKVDNILTDEVKEWINDRGSNNTLDSWKDYGFGYTHDPLHNKWGPKGFSLQEELRNKGYDWLVFEDEFPANAITHWLLKEVGLEGVPIKSANPITYDNAGNVIPLSQRFSRQSEDIRNPKRNPATPEDVPKHYKSVDTFREYWNALGVRNMTDTRGKGTPYEHIRPSEIQVEKANRNKGLGTAFMQDLTEFADLKGMQIRLNPSDELGATSKGRLEKFYKRFGFVENKSGKNKDYAISERFYRQPKRIAMKTKEFRNPMIRTKLSRILEPGDRVLDYDRAQGEDLYRLWDMVHTDKPLTKEALVEIEGMLDDDGVLVIQSGEEPSGLKDHFRRATRYQGMLLVQGPMNPEEARINTEKLRRDLE